MFKPLQVLNTWVHGYIWSMVEYSNEGMDVCAFGAHPDDVELSAGGTLARAVHDGQRIALVDLTRGELGTRGSAEIRDQEAVEAARILGVTHRENLDLGDGFFGVNQDAILAVVEVLRRLRPRMVLANAKSDRHPDHGRASDLVVRACFLSGLVKIETRDKNTDEMQLPWRPAAVYHYIQDRWQEPDVVVDITGYEATKKAAILAYGSQFYPGTEDAGPQTPISSPEFMQHIDGRNLAMGRLGGVKFAEGFQVNRPPVVKDLRDLA